jgi:4-carboxymuconolactone decarboxylase
MSNLTPRERELVALGAAMGSNCVPCIEYHIPEAKKAGLTDPQLSEAIRFADEVRQVPARKALNAALRMLPDTSAGMPVGSSKSGETEKASMAGGPCCN